MILLISHVADPHATAVLASLHAAGADAVLFDTGRFPDGIRVGVTHASGERSGSRLRGT